MINRKILLNSVLLALSLFLGYSIVNIDSPFSSLSYFNDEKRPQVLERAVKSGTGNPEIYFKLGNLKDILLASEEDEVKSLYLETVKRNPLHVIAFLKLADIGISDGNTKSAAKIARIAEKYSSMSAERLWELSFIAYKLQDMALFYRSLNTVASIDDLRKDYVYQLALKLVDDKSDILRYIISENIFDHYFGYITRVSDLETVKSAYQYAGANNFNIEKETKLKYLEFLIRNNQGEEALDVWVSIYGPSGTKVWNGGFENDIIDHGFGWRINDIYDSEYETKTGFEKVNPLRDKRSLKVTFLNKNPDYRNISQYVVVNPGKRHLFSSVITTRDLTSDKGIGWEISCVAGGNLYEQTEYLLGTNTEKLVLKDFTPPGDCRIIRINLRRHKSDKFNKYISGEVLVDDVSVSESY